jgi:hypothetical protein
MSALSTTETTLAARGRHVAQRAQQRKQPRSYDLHRDRRQQERRNRSTAERLDGYVQALTNRNRRFSYIALIYLEQVTVQPVQVNITLSYLAEVRRIAGSACVYLDGLEPEEIQRIKPFGCITKLRSVESLLTELLLIVGMFATVCQVISPDRVWVHMWIRTAFPALLTAYDDLLAQLRALADKARHEVTAVEVRKEVAQ